LDKRQTGDKVETTEVIGFEEERSAPALEPVNG
jgi:hypothetical protein